MKSLRKQVKETKIKRSKKLTNVGLLCVLSAGPFAALYGTAVQEAGAYDIHSELESDKPQLTILENSKIENEIIAENFEENIKEVETKAEEVKEEKEVKVEKAKVEEKIDKSDKLSDSQKNTLKAEVQKQDSKSNVKAVEAKVDNVNSIANFQPKQVVNNTINSPATPVAVADNTISNVGGNVDNTVANNTQSAPSSKGQAILNAAMAQIGVYQDCTMLVTNSLKSVGLNHHGWPISYLGLGKVVSYEEAQPGDLIYYSDGGLGYAHIAVYVGNGKAVHGGWNNHVTVLESAFVGSGPVFIRIP